ncbi:COG4775 Outer membrane protein/protective antigen OMA87 [Fimbriimonadaceae bacterium]
MTKNLAAFALLFLTSAAAIAQEATNIKEVIIRGNKRVTVETISGIIRTKVGQPYIQENLDRDKKALEDLGFFSAVSVRATPLESGQYSVTVDLVEFPEIKEIRVTGNTVVTTEQILAVVSLKPGDVFNANALAPSIRAIEKLYADKSYFAQVLDFTPLEGSTGTINLAISEIKVGTISVQGNVRTKDWVFKRLIKTRSGNAFNGERWGKDLRRVAGSGWFEPGTIRSIEDPDREVGKVDLTVEVKEGRTGRFDVGLQLDPQNSLAGVVRLSENNLGGTGQGVTLDYLQTTQGGGASVGLEYINPFYDDKDTTVSVSVYSRVIYRFNNFFNSNTPTTDNSVFERRAGGTLALARPIKEDLTFGISGRYESTKTFNGSTSTGTGFIQQDGTVSTVAFALTSDKRDLVVDPSRGDFLRLEFEPGLTRIDRIGGAITDTSLLGNSSFTKSAIEYRRYFTNQPARGRNDPDAPRRVLAFRARYGTISGTVPFFEQYFAGGANSIRGYDEDRFWGRQQLVTNLEYRYPVQRSFNIIGFADYGGAWGGYGAINNFSQSNKFKMHLGYGLGLAFRTPLGPIRIDFGFNEDGQSRTHFLIGTSF